MNVPQQNNPILISLFYVVEACNVNCYKCSLSILAKKTRTQDFSPLRIDKRYFIFMCLLFGTNFNFPTNKCQCDSCLWDIGICTAVLEVLVPAANLCYAIGIDSGGR